MRQMLTYYVSFASSSDRSSPPRLGAELGDLTKALRCGCLSSSMPGAGAGWQQRRRRRKGGGRGGGRRKHGFEGRGRKRRAEGPSGAPTSCEDSRDVCSAPLPLVRLRYLLVQPLASFFHLFSRDGRQPLRRKAAICYSMLKPKHKCLHLLDVVMGEQREQGA